MTELEMTLRKGCKMQNVLKTGNSTANMVRATNVYAMSVLRCSLGVVCWTRTDVEGINTLIRTTVTRYKMHHSRSRLRGLCCRGRTAADDGGHVIDVVGARYRQMKGLRMYFPGSNSELRRAVAEAGKECAPLSLSSKQFQSLEIGTVADRKLT